MKRFSFRLQVLLDIKKRAEDDIKKELAQKNRDILYAQKEQQCTMENLEQFISVEKKKRVDSCDVRSLRNSISYRAKLQRDIMQKGNQIENFVAEAGRITMLLIQARKESRILEILKEKKFGQWKKDNAAEEQISQDDVSQKMFMLNRRNAARHSEPVSV
jgi:flagellar FliJ protein